MTRICATLAVVTQPGSGKNIMLRLKGGEQFSFVGRRCWYRRVHFVRNDGGDFVYAELLNDGTLGPSSDRVGDIDPEARQIPKNLVMSNEVRDRICKQHKLLCGNMDYDKGFNEHQACVCLEVLQPVAQGCCQTRSKHDVTHPLHLKISVESQMLRSS